MSRKRVPLCGVHVVGHGCSSLHAGSSAAVLYPVRGTPRWRLRAKRRCASARQSRAHSPREPSSAVNRWARKIRHRSAAGAGRHRQRLRCGHRRGETSSNVVDRSARSRGVLHSCIRSRGSGQSCGSRVARYPASSAVPALERSGGSQARAREQSLPLFSRPFRRRKQHQQIDEFREIRRGTWRQHGFEKWQAPARRHGAPLSTCSQLPDGPRAAVEPWPADAARICCPVVTRW